LYTIVFKGWNIPTTLPASLLRPLGTDDPSQSSGFKRKTVELDEREKEKRKKKNEKWQEVKAAKTAETNEKKNAWEKFGKKATKKGVKIGG
jgi:survival-of-motor-neuron-related-splicing factor 30